MNPVVETIIRAASFVVGYLIGTVIFIAVLKRKDKKDGKDNGNR